MTANLYASLCGETPRCDREFICTPAGARLGYGDLDNGTARFANALIGLGVRPGDRVAVQVEKSPEALLLYLACLRAGAVYLPLNTAYTMAELEYFIADAEPRLVVCAPERSAEIEAMATRIANARTETLGDGGGAGTLAALAAAAPDQFATHSCGADELAAILYTSGTTGRSKGAMLSHGNLVSNARVLAEYWRVTEDDRLIHALPIYHTHGLFVATNTILAAGASMIFLPRFDPDAVVAALPHATMMMGVPTFYTRLLRDDRLDHERTRGLRLFISGSAPLLAETHHAWLARTGHAILERYGMTETGMNTSNPNDGARVAGSVGLPLPGIGLRVVDPESGAPLAPATTGMIEVRGPNVFGGYWRMPEKTKAAFRSDGFFVTGDLGYVDQGGYVFLVGRGSDLIISGGFNVYPKEVEAEIDAIDGVEESAVIGVPHPDFGEGVTALVVLRPRAALDERRILDVLAARLANYKLPKRVMFVDALPRNAMAKVQKAALRQRYATLYTACNSGQVAATTG